jgi:hypothetical protein
VKPEFNFPLAISQYLVDNWDVLAASAYSNFLKKGRGLLWLDWLNQLPITSRLSDVPVVYATPHSRITRGLFPDGMSSDVRRLIRQYDPAISVVLYWSDGEINRCRTLGLSSKTPIEAYEQLKGQLDEFEMLVDLEKEERS